jgi:hypothetical protein
MAAGAILPLLFFERRRPAEHLRSGHGILKGIRKTLAASITRLSGRRAYVTISSEPSPPKDI